MFSALYALACDVRGLERALNGWFTIGTLTTCNLHAGKSPWVICSATMLGLLHGQLSLRTRVESIAAYTVGLGKSESFVMLSGL